MNTFQNLAFNHRTHSHCDDVYGGMSKVSNFTFIFNLKLDNGASGGVSLISKRAKAHNKKGNGTLYFAFCLAEEGNQEALINHLLRSVESELRLTCVMVDEVRLSLVSVGLLPVRGQGTQTIVIRGVGVTGVSVVLGDALTAAAACIVRTHA